MKNSAHDGIEVLGSQNASPNLENTLKEKGLKDEANVVGICKSLKMNLQQKNKTCIRFLNPNHDSYIETDDERILSFFHSIDEKHSYSSKEEEKNREVDKIKLNFFVEDEPMGMPMHELLNALGLYKMGRPSTYASIIHDLETLEKEQLPLIEHENEAKVVHAGLAAIKEEGNNLSVILFAKGIEAYLKVKQTKPEWASPFFSLHLTTLLEHVENLTMTPVDALAEICELLDPDIKPEQLEPEFWNDIDNIYKSQESF
ncbi:MAG: hypothetical protein ACJAS1_006914 [Oleiphilaceae bacterium]|jgi:hypothetical protein